MRLSNATLQDVPAAVMRPAYDRSKLRTGIVHLGLGAFARAHLAVYIDDVLAADPSWAMAGVSLKSPTTRDALGPQDGLYTLSVKGPEATRRRVVGAVPEVLVATEAASALLDRLTAPATRIVSLTITEKGYGHDPATGRLEAARGDIARDLAGAATPATALGWVAEALARRRAAGTPPFTLLSCDNLPDNGHTLRHALLEFLERSRPELAAWAETAVACPATMVDRIVPATTDADRAAVAAALGVSDAWPVETEPFTQFVVEDRFPEGRPDWERVGVQMVADVAPFERMKLRMLNGSHSTLAYLGYLMGHETVTEAIADEPLRQLIDGLMKAEAAPTLAMPQGVDLEAYADALLARFANPALRHRTWQIAMDGSQKLPQRLLGTARERLARSLPITRTALGIAAWMRYACGTDEHGRAIDVRDPLGERFARIAADSSDPDARVDGFLALKEVFDEDLPQNDGFTAPVRRAFKRLAIQGARATVRSTLDELAAPAD